MQPQTRAVAAVMSAGRTYVDKVRGYSPIAYWPLWETTGSVAQCFPNTAMNGAYTGVTLANAIGPDGVNYAPLFDGANDYVNIYSTAFRDAFNGTEGTIMIWGKVFNVGVWTDGNNRYVNYLAVDSDNRLRLRKDTVNNTFTFLYEANNSTEVSAQGGQSSTSWVHYAMTWSKTADQVIYYIAGSDVETDVGLDTWVGSLASTTVLIGAISTGPIEPWYGWLAHCAVWDSPLSGTAIADLATV